MAERDFCLTSVFLSYSALFVLCAIVIFLPYAVFGRSFVYRVDGSSQYIVYLRYMGQYLRDWIRRIAQGSFAPVMYDFTIGMGDDINAIVRFHPLDFLSVFVPVKYTEYLYDAILLIRYYLSGLSFCAYAYYWKDARTRGRVMLPYPVSMAGILTGSMIYVFCGYMMLRVMNHPTYAAPFIVLPLLLLAVERMREGKGMLLFPAAVFLGFVSNYYFMYICSIALLVYVLLRLPDYLACAAQNGKKRPGAFFSLALRMVSLYALGLGMSLVTLLPTLIRYAGSYRTAQTAQRQNLLFYADPRRYAAWIVNLITPYVSSGNGTNLNYAVIVFPALVLLFFFCRGKLRILKVILVLELACLLIPLGGYIMAGFNNENNRWMFLISLALGMTAVFMMGGFACLDAARRRALTVSAVVFVLVSGAIALFSARKAFALAAMLELSACCVILIVLGRKRASERTVHRAVLLMTCISVTVNAWMAFLPAFGNSVSRSARAGHANYHFENGIGSAVKKTDADGFYRVDSSAVKASSENSGIYYGYCGVSMYNSILNTALVHAMVEEDNIGLDSITHIQDLDGRIPSESLAGVRYFVTKTRGDRPYGFSDEPVLEADGFYIYENELALPFAAGFRRVILRQDYEKLDPAERELVQLHAAVVEPGELPDAEGLSRISAPPEEILTKSLPLPDGSEGIVRTKDGYRVETGGAALALTYEKKPGYLCLLRLNGFTGSRNAAFVSVISESTWKKFYLRGPGNTYTLGRDDYLVSLMAQSAQNEAGGRTGLSVVFRSPGDYRLDSMQAVYIPVSGFAAGVEELSEESMTDPDISGNRITGKLSLSGERLVTFQVLSQKGWTLFVDGKKTPLLRANVCYLGALLPAGEHEVLLVYETPGLRMGAVVSLVSFLAWIALAVYVWKKPSGAETSAPVL